MSKPAVGALCYGLGIASGPFLAVGAGMLAARLHDWNLARNR